MMINQSMMTQAESRLVRGFYYINVLALAWLLISTIKLAFALSKNEALKDWLVRDWFPT